MNIKGLLLILFLFSFNTTNAQWSQLGSELIGEDSSDNSGKSVSLSSNGSRVAIGSPENDNNGTSAGHVRIFQWSGNDWVQLGSAIEGEAANDKSGFSVSLSSDGARVAIGAIGNDGNGSLAGHVRIYEWNGSGWNQLGSDIDGEAPGDNSGSSVSLSATGNRVAIGAERNDGNGLDVGHVRVYEWNGSDWSQVGSDIDGEAGAYFCGFSVSISSDGNRVAAGANGNDGNGSGAGRVRIYEWTGTAWNQLGSDLDGEALNDGFGNSVSLSSDGNRVAIGAPFNDGNGSGSGHVRIYDWTGTVWSQVGTDIDGEAPNDRSGHSVSLSSDGNYVAVGALFNDGNGNNAGHTRIYTWTGSSWNQVGSDIDGGEPGYQSGYSVSVSANGGRLAVGAPFGGTFENAGRVQVFENVLITSAQLISNEVSAIIFPNPSNGLFQIKTEGSMVYRVFDSLGQLVNTEANAWPITVDLSEEPQGVYTLMLITESGWATQKLVKQ